MADEREITTVFRADISQFSASTQQLNKYVSQVNSEFNNATASMGRWNDNADGLRAKITQLNKVHDAESRKLKMLEDSYADIVRTQGANSKAAQKLATDINNQSAKVKETKRNIDFYSDSLKELEDAGVSTRKELDELNKKIEENGESSSKIGGAMKGAAAGVAAVGAMAVATVGSFLSLAESTREVRENFSRLETSFEGAGLSADQAQSTYTELYGVLGDTGRATEAAQQLAQISKTEADLAANTKILTGVMATYGDSIPTEGLAEGMAATAAMGEVQGVLADALEWQGVNLEEYNKELANLATEEERAAYIQSTLTDLYGESADAFKEKNQAIIEAREAEAELSKVTAELGAIAEPIMTTLKVLATDLLKAITPFVGLIGEGLTGALEGTAGATDTLAEGINGIVTTLLEKVNTLLPTLVDVITSLLPKVIETILAALPELINTLASLIKQVLDALSSMLPTLIPIIIDALLMVVETILDNLDMIIDAAIALVSALADGIVNAIPKLIDKVPIIIEKLVGAITRNMPKLQQSGIEIIIKLAGGLIKAIPQLISKIPEIIAAIVRGFSENSGEMDGVGENLLKGIWEGITGAADWLKKKIAGFAGNVADWFKDAFKIKSPSKLMEDDVGRYIGEGVGVGIVDSEDDVKKDIDHFSKELVNNMQYSLAGASTDTSALTQIGAAGKRVTVNNGAAMLDQLASKLNVTGASNNTVNNFNYKFEKMETSRHALHKANIETKRILMGV